MLPTVPLFVILTHLEMWTTSATATSIARPRLRLDSQYPPSYADTVDGHLDDTNDIHQPYPVQQGRQSRFQAFEDHLRQNRVDITSSCRSCDVKKDKAA